MNTEAEPEASPSIAFDPAQRKRGIVVGFDGSENSLKALEFGARTAKLRGVMLTVITAYRVAPMFYTTFAAIPEDSEESTSRREAGAILEAAREHLDGYPGSVDYQYGRGDAAGVLAEISRFAELVVVGSRGRGGFLELVLGSVASALPSHAQSPIVVVPNSDDQNENKIDWTDPDSSSKPVVVGVDGSTQGRVAALHAAQAAQERSADLHMVMALPPLDGLSLWYPEYIDKGAVEKRQAELSQFLKDEVDWLSSHYPSLSIVPSVEPDDAISLLTSWSRQAQLTVVGTHGTGAIAGTLLGSTSRGLLHHAGSPVMVVPGLEDARISS